ncbi:MAG TPA: AraC family transcriptional regulator, partial [Allocoleopsis sp.]
EVLTMPDQRIPRTLHYAVWQEVVKQTGNENPGLHVGELFSLGNFGIAGYVLLNCQTLKDVFEKFCRYTCLFCQGVLSNLSISDGMAFLECSSVPEPVPSPQLLEDARYDIEDTFVSALTAIRALTGKELSPAAVWFCHRAPSDLGEHKRIFQTELKFSMPANRLFFDANCLDWSVLSSNANLLPLFEQHADLMLEEINRTNPYTRQVVQAIAQQISRELPTIQAIARELSISVRQLQRELNTEGTTFQKLLDETRKELALRHLRNPSTPIHDIAFLLGFSEPSAFNRAFKRWTGKTPGSYRHTQQLSAIRY